MDNLSDRTCQLCEKVLCSAKGKLGHLISAHDLIPPGLEVFRCSFCGVFKSIDSYRQRRHERYCAKKIRNTGTPVQNSVSAAPAPSPVVPRSELSTTSTSGGREDEEAGPSNRQPGHSQSQSETPVNKLRRNSSLRNNESLQLKRIKMEEEEEEEEEVETQEIAIPPGDSNSQEEYLRSEEVADETQTLSGGNGSDADDNTSETEFLSVGGSVHDWFTGAGSPWTDADSIELVRKAGLEFIKRRGSAPTSLTELIEFDKTLHSISTRMTPQAPGSSLASDASPSSSGWANENKNAVFLQLVPGKIDLGANLELTGSRLITPISKEYPMFVLHKKDLETIRKLAKYQLTNEF